MLKKDAAWQHKPSDSQKPMITDSGRFHEIQPRDIDKEQEEKLSMFIEGDQKTTELKAFKSPLLNALSKDLPKVATSATQPVKASTTASGIPKPRTKLPSQTGLFKGQGENNMENLIKTDQGQAKFGDKKAAEAFAGKIGGKVVPAKSGFFVNYNRVAKQSDLKESSDLPKTPNAMEGLAMKNDPPVRVPKPQFEVKNARAEMLKSLGVSLPGTEVDLEKSKLGDIARSIGNKIAGPRLSANKLKSGATVYTPKPSVASTVGSKIGQAAKNVGSAIDRGLTKVEGPGGANPLGPAPKLPPKRDKKTNKFKKRNFIDNILWRSEEAGILPGAGYILMLSKRNGPEPDPAEDKRYEVGNGGEIQLKPEERAAEAEHKMEDR